VIGLIVGSGFARFAVASHRERIIDTEFGTPSSLIREYRIGGVSVLGLARHGEEGLIPPHAVNYRANLIALHQCGVTSLIGLNLVGAIATGFSLGALAVPDQLIDYTHGRESSFWRPGQPFVHIDFTQPFDPWLAGCLAEAAGVVLGGVYGVTQGPRLETSAEIDRLEHDGCSMVGMTAMPEAALARELELPYAIYAIAVNHAAGRGSGDIHAEIDHFVALGMQKAVAALEIALPAVERAAM
jgi:5'-methylthioinosine phosphorylase